MIGLVVGRITISAELSLINSADFICYSLIFQIFIFLILLFSLSLFSSFLNKDFYKELPAVILSLVAFANIISGFVKP